LGSERSRPPKKIPRNAPIYFFPQKKNLQDFQNQKYIGIFMAQIERETERERKREREREGERKSDQEQERERERERERENKSAGAILFINRRGQNEKSARY
jgi:hypothetical protein